jgi:hypothetical protein
MPPRGSVGEDYTQVGGPPYLLFEGEAEGYDIVLGYRIIPGDSQQVAHRVQSADLRLETDIRAIPTGDISIAAEYESESTGDLVEAVIRESRNFAKLGNADYYFVDLTSPGIITSPVPPFRGRPYVVVRPLLFRGI